MSSISVLESVQPEKLVDGLFPRGEFYGSEIVITGFMNMVDDCYEDKLLLFLGSPASLQEAGRCLLALRALQKDRENQVLLETLKVYLLDGDGSITRTAELLYLHKNTVKYRIRRICDLLGYHPDRQPKAAALYRAAAPSSCRSSLRGRPG